MKRIISLLAFTVFLTSSAMALHEDSKEGSFKKGLTEEIVTVQGIISKIDESSKILILKVGLANESFTISDNVTVKGKASINDFKVGDKVSITYKVTKGKKTIDTITALK